MKKAIAAVALALLAACSISLRAQNVEDTSAPPIEPDSGYSVPGNGPITGQIHGFIPDNWAASMITLVDLQTEDGQRCFSGLSAARSIHDQTQFVCQNPGQDRTSSDTGDFYFYDLPAGSYVVAACMQAPDGNWRSGAQVIQLNEGQDATMALGPANGPVMRGGVAFAPDFYVGLWAPVGFGANFAWGWPVAAWHSTVFYRRPVARIAPIWVRPGPVFVGARIFVPPYNSVLHGGYTYAGYRNGGFVQLTARAGVVLPPAHQFHPVTPEVEARMHANASANVRTAQPRREPAPVFGEQPRARENDARTAPVVRDNARPAAPEARGSEARSDVRTGVAPARREEPRAVQPTQPRTESRPAQAPAQAPAAVPQARAQQQPEHREEARPAPTPAPQPRQEARPAPQPRQESRPGAAARKEARPAPRTE